jgi:hypothetical protein
MVDIKTILAKAIENGASDVHSCQQRGCKRNGSVDGWPGQI